MKTNIRHNSLFMIELIISIFFFIICASICVQAFVKAHILTQKTDNMNQAYAICQNLSSIFYQNDYTHSEDNIKTYFDLTKQIYHEQDCTEQFTSDSLHSFIQLIDFMNPEKTKSETEPFLNEQNTQYLILLYDSDWNPCTSLQNACYFTLCEYTYDNSFRYERIIIGKDFQNLYTACDTTLVSSISMPDYNPIIYSLDLKVFYGGKV